MRAKFSDLVGKTILSIDQNLMPTVLRMIADDGFAYIQYHEQDCCEGVQIEEIVGDLSDLIGAPILLAEETESINETPEGVTPPEYPDSYTWTFYKLATIKGHVTIRWLGESNGYYAEGVDFRREQVE